jgi:lipopolysaccharide export system protein LptA
MTRFCLVLALVILALPLRAELADRDKPITLEADRITLDDLKRVHVFEGNVVLTQGTLVIRSDRIVVTEDAQGYQRGVAFSGPGGLARFRQKREGRDDWIEGEAERIEYDTHHEIAELFHRAWIQSGKDQLRGDYIWYDGISERYLASSNPDSAPKPGQNLSSPPRVEAIIQPRNKTNAADTTPKPPDPAKNEGDPTPNTPSPPAEPESP